MSAEPLDGKQDPKVTRFRLERSRSVLRDILRWVPSEDFIQMVWAVDLLQGDEPNVAKRFFDNLPDQAINAKIGDKHFAYKWLLEDLINELLVARPASRRNLPHRVLNCRNYDGFAHAYNALHEIQDSEQILNVARQDNILAEMARIGHRQFSWQQPALNIPNFYRAAALYGDGELSRIYSEERGITPSNMMMLGLGVWAQLGTNPMFSPKSMILPEVGLTTEVVEAGLRLLTAPLAEQRRRAAELRGLGRDRIYRPSALRSYPCISFGSAGERIMAPLRELVLTRCTEGLYYDLVGISDNVRRELGRAFEEYAVKFISAIMDRPVTGNLEYRFKGNKIHSPDILVGRPQEIGMVIECKATRMTFDARFATDRRVAGRRGFDELSKAVRQIWRFVSHVRQGLVPEHQAKDDVFGLVLTVDPWLRMTVGEHEAIFDHARQWCAQNEPEIGAADQCPVGFTHIEDFERMALQTDANGVTTTCRLGSDPNYIGWGFNDLRGRATAPAIEREYPFRNEMGLMLPWWDTIDEVKRRRENPAS